MPHDMVKPSHKVCGGFLQNCGKVWKEKSVSQKQKAERKIAIGGS